MIKCNSHVIADMKGLDLFVKECINLEKKEIGIGFDETKHPDADMSMAALAWILDRGADIPNGVIPPRDFMESTNDQFEVDNGRVTPLAVKKILYRGQAPESALKPVGNAQKRTMQEIMDIKLFSNPNNAPSTIRQKGRDDALIDTGKLRKAIKVRIGDKESDVGED
ncbi:MAG: hypothetical protein EOM41_01150 [Bacilli bacterium]|nr:hypothetical protein [Bacilli bacterium]